MADIGFVYILGNRSMPGVFKIGSTLYAPSRRAAELSSGSGVPQPFEVLAFGEVESPRDFELELHQLFSAFRVSPNREFFRVSLQNIVDALTNNCSIVAESHHDDGFWRRD